MFQTTNWHLRLADGILMPSLRKYSSLAAIIMDCLFCDEPVGKSSIEHIVPESLGNIWYMLPSGYVCDTCNGNFSKFEDKAISKTQLGFIRILNGIRTKKGKPSSFQIGNIKGEGTENSDKNLLTIYGLEDKDIVSSDPKNKTHNILVPDFDKSEMATSKMLLKMAFESISKSKKEIISKYDFTNLKNYLTKKDNKDWPFLTASKEFYSFKSIPTFNDKHNLNKIKCKLKLSEVSENVLLFAFCYDYLTLVINLLNRDYSWTKIYLEKDHMPGLYPRYLHKP